MRYEALRGYVRHHAKSDGCRPVMDMLADPNEHVALLAIDSLGNCAGDEDVVNRLMGEARTPPNIGSWRRESHALVSLAKRSPGRLEVPMISHSRHVVWQVRMYAARAAADRGCGRRRSSGWRWIRTTTSGTQPSERCDV